MGGVLGGEGESGEEGITIRLYFVGGARAGGVAAVVVVLPSEGEEEGGGGGAAGEIVVSLRNNDATPEETVDHAEVSRAGKVESMGTPVIDKDRKFDNGGSNGLMSTYRGITLMLLPPINRNSLDPPALPTPIPILPPIFLISLHAFWYSSIRFSTSPSLPASTSFMIRIISSKGGKCDNIKEP